MGGPRGDPTKKNEYAEEKSLKQTEVNGVKLSKSTNCDGSFI